MSVAAESMATPALVQSLLEDLKPRAKSLIVTVFGDAILPHGGEVWLGDLIRLMEVFEIGERLVRTSVFRLTHDGVLAPRQVGRRSIYALTAGGRRQFDAAQRKIYAPLGERREPESDSPWTIALLTAAVDAAARESLRQELGWAGFGALGTHVLIGAGNDLKRAKQTVAALGLDRNVALFEATSGSAANSLRALCHDAWKLDETDRQYRAFIERFTSLEEQLYSQDVPPSPEEAFALRTLMIHAYRRTLLKDPGLPPALMPDNWSGRTARKLAARIYAKLQYSAQAFIETSIEGTDGPLPAATAQFSARFMRIIPD
ncbi:PaaX family transcriptional regulator [Nisaea sediminum]|uniref:PaaX family transcriptional regulator n=1 Tax=Nisaea sediminum TaxID=2775867 RepID=UPI001867220A|nr:PaaX family transcriptional regulator C-terminal domain-containing protein [Nisaea sediminum]